MGLAFLNKKGWHTGAFKNIEEVWKAEEKEKDRKKKDEELKKKLVEEKYNNELKKMQVEAGLLPKSELDKMDWMYNFYDHANTKNNAEEYLLGKKVEKVEETTNLKERVYNQSFQKSGFDANEEFQKL
jgi:hypothetical protein